MSLYWPPLDDDFFEELHGLVTTPYICGSCTKPTCSCAGGSRTRACLLPGEQEWAERKVGKKLPMAAPYLYEVQGDCTYLECGRCCADNLKPWDCLAYPLCPIWDEQTSQWLPSYARNCSYPTQIPISWIREVWTGWQLIAREVEPSWLVWYSSIPDFYETDLLQIK